MFELARPEVRLSIQLNHSKESKEIISTKQEGIGGYTWRSHQSSGRNLKDIGTCAKNFQLDIQIISHKIENVNLQKHRVSRGLP
jgi:hypothetical protein